MPAARFLSAAVLAALAFALPPILAASGAAFLLTQLTMSAYYGLASLGLCALMGYAGQISLGQAGFFAIGGYASAFLCTRDLGPVAGTRLARLLGSAGLLVGGTDPYGKALLSLEPRLAAVLAVLLAVLVAALLGGPVLRLKGHYLAMATLGFGIVIEKVARGTRALGGADGISAVPGLPLFAGLSVAGGRAARAANFTISWLVLALGALVLAHLVSSRPGRALRALRDGEEAASAMGVDTARYKLDVFVIGAAFAAIAGVLSTHYNGSIGPGEAASTRSVRYLAIVAVGGMDSLAGTLVAGLVLNFLSLRGVFGSLDDAVFGAILILVMLLSPEGKAARAFAALLPRRKVAPR